MNKLCISNYRDYDNLRRWALVYCPKLILFFDNIMINENDFNKEKEEWVLRRRSKFKQDYVRLGRFTDNTEAFNNLKGYYKRTFTNLSISDEQVWDETMLIIERFKLSNEEIGDLYSYPILNLTPKIERYLKWRCPISSIREYFYRNYKFKKNFNWFYRLFWKGTKYFE